MVTCLITISHMYACLITTGHMCYCYYRSCSTSLYTSTLYRKKQVIIFIFKGDNVDPCLFPGIISKHKRKHEKALKINKRSIYWKHWCLFIQYKLPALLKKWWCGKFASLSCVNRVNITSLKVTKNHHIIIIISVMLEQKTFFCFEKQFLHLWIYC